VRQIEASTQQAVWESFDPYSSWRSGNQPLHTY